MGKSSGSTRASSSVSPKGLVVGRYSNDTEATAKQYADMRSEMFAEAERLGWDSRFTDIAKNYSDDSPVGGIRVLVEPDGDGKGATRNIFKAAVMSSLLYTSKATMGSEESGNYVSELRELENTFRNTGFKTAREAMEFADKAAKAFNKKWK